MAYGLKASSCDPLSRTSLQIDMQNFVCTKSDLWQRKWKKKHKKVISPNFEIWSFIISVTVCWSFLLVLYHQPETSALNYQRKIQFCDLLSCEVKNFIIGCDFGARGPQFTTIYLYLYFCRAFVFCLFETNKWRSITLFRPKKVIVWMSSTIFFFFFWVGAGGRFFFLQIKVKAAGI